MGDNLKVEPFKNILQVVLEIMKKIITTDEWTTDDRQKYVVKAIAQKKQEDAFSCLFYIVSYIRHFYSNIGCI